MINYPQLSQNPKQFLSLTCYTIEEFQALLPHFTAKFQEYMENFTFEGQPRKRRQYVEYQNSSLPTTPNKLLFILRNEKGNDLQEKLALMFDMHQSKANLWIHLLQTVLNQALEDIEMLPARNAQSLDKKREEFLTENATKLNISTEVERTSLEAEGFKTVQQEVEEEVEMVSSESEEELVEIELYLHDGTERPINRPLNSEKQKLYYSGKKKRHTLKNNLLINISSEILFLSNTCEGKKHDKKIADEAGYQLPHGSYLDQDTGFQGFEMP